MDELIPLRIATGWAVRWNEFDRTNTSEDLLLLTHMDGSSDKCDGLFIDVGWYRDTYRAVLLLHGWEVDPLAEIDSKNANEIVQAIEDWMLNWSRYYRQPISPA